MSVDEFYSDMKRQIGSEKFDRLDNYRSRVRKLFLGVVAGIGLVVAGAKLDKEAVEYVGYGVLFATGIIAQVYKNKADRLEGKINEDIDIIRKGGVIDDKLI